MDEVSVVCPWCFEAQSLELAPEEHGTFVQDCEVCCRPWQVSVSRDAAGEPSVTVERG